MNNLIVKPGFIASLLRAVGLVKVDSDGKVDHNAGADFVEDTLRISARCLYALTEDVALTPRSWILTRSWSCCINRRRESVAFCSGGNCTQTWSSPGTLSF